MRLVQIGGTCTTITTDGFNNSIIYNGKVLTGNVNECTNNSPLEIAVNLIFLLGFILIIIGCCCCCCYRRLNRKKLIIYNQQQQTNNHV
jgi:hypothetical protein